MPCTLCVCAWSLIGEFPAKGHMVTSVEEPVHYRHLHIQDTTPFIKLLVTCFHWFKWSCFLAVTLPSTISLTYITAILCANACRQARCSSHQLLSVTCQWPDDAHCGMSETSSEIIRQFRCSKSGGRNTSSMWNPQFSWLYRNRWWALICVCHSFRIILHIENIIKQTDLIKLYCCIILVPSGASWIFF